MPSRKLRPGQQFDSWELNELASGVDKLDQINTGAGNVSVGRDNNVPVVRDLSDVVILGRITGSPTSNKYPWVQVARNSDGTYTDYDEWRLFGSATVCPAVELGGRTDVATGSIVELRPLPSGDGWGFVFGAGASAANWSLTTSGVLTTALAAQVGTGLKVSRQQSLSQSAGWHVQVEIFDVGATPYYSLYTSASYGPCLYQVTQTSVPSTTYLAPLNVSQNIVAIGATFGTGLGGMSAYMSTSAAPSGAVTATHWFYVGVLGSLSHASGYGVVRANKLRRGIDRDFAVGDRPIVRGGIVVGYIDSGGTTHFVDIGVGESVGDI